MGDGNDRIGLQQLGPFRRGVGNECARFQQEPRTWPYGYQGFREDRSPTRPGQRRQEKLLDFMDEEGRENRRDRARFSSSAGPGGALCRCRGRARRRRKAVLLRVKEGGV